GRTSPPRRSPGSRCAWCRRPTRTARRSTPGQRRPGPDGPPPSRTPRSCGPTCPTGACPHRGQQLLPPSGDHLPLPHHVLALVVLEQRGEHELDLGPHPQRVGISLDLAHDDELLV